MSKQETAESVKKRLADAENLMGQGLYEEALIPLNKAIFLTPNDPLLYIARADAYLGIYDLSSAIQNYRRADKLEQGNELRIPGSALNPTAMRLSELHAIYARRLLSSKRYDGAEAQAKFATALRPQHQPFRVLVVLALTGAGKWDDALAEVTSILEQNPRQPDLYVLRCRINIEKQCLEQVVDDLTRLMQLAPDHSEVQALSQGMHQWTEDLVSKAMGQTMQARYDEALQLLDRALNLRPGDADLLYRRGMCQRLKGSYEDAMKDMEDAIDAAGGVYPDAARQLRILHNEMGVQYHGWNLYPEAIEQFDLAIRGQTGSEGMDEAMAMVYANRGDCYKLLGSDDKALQDYELCIRELNRIRRQDLPDGKPMTIDEEAYSRIAGKCAASLYNRGRLAVTFGEYSRAASFYTKAIEMCPNVPDYIFQRAVILHRLDMHKQQKEDLERVLTLNPKHEQARIMLQKVSPHHELVLEAGVKGLSMTGTG